MISFAGGGSGALAQFERHYEQIAQPFQWRLPAAISTIGWKNCPSKTPTISLGGLTPTIR